MKDINQACAELNVLSHRIENNLRLFNYYNYNDLSNFAVDIRKNRRSASEHLTQTNVNLDTN